MKFPFLRRKLPMEPADACYLDDSEDILNLARQIIDGKHPGVLTTVDENGCPHARWMASLSFDEFPFLYTLTAPKTPKLAHLVSHPMVDWMFSNHDLTLILNLRGYAQALTDAQSIKHAWNIIQDKSHAYFLENFSERPGIAVIRTRIQQIECTIPKSGLHWRMDADLFKPCFVPPQTAV